MRYGIRVGGWCKKGMKVTLLSRVQLFVTPWTLAYQALSSIGFSRQECWSELPFPSPEALLDPGIERRSPAMQADALPSEPSVWGGWGWWESGKQPGGVGGGAEHERKIYKDRYAFRFPVPDPTSSLVFPPLSLTSLICESK